MSFTETLQSITGKLLADCTDQELYLALLELVRQKSASCCPTTSSIWGCTTKPGLRWLLPESAFPTLKR